jgi:hypothetical protein
MKCRKCKGDCEPIIKGGQFVFNFCRACKLPYSSDGDVIFENPSQLVSHFNPIAAARKVVSKTHSGSSSVAKTAFEVLLTQSLLESYMNGMKDGVLLAYSQDVGNSEPVDPK